jgi:hypothetical protein
VIANQTMSYEKFDATMGIGSGNSSEEDFAVYAYYNKPLKLHTALNIHHLHVLSFKGLNVTRKILDNTCFKGTNNAFL